jgi:hypothetical protein
MLWLQGSSESTYPIPTLYSSPYSSYPRPHDLPYSGDRPTLDLRGGKDFLRGQVQPAYPRPTDLPLDPLRPPTLYLPYTSPTFKQPSCLPQGQQRAAEWPVQLSSLSCTCWHRLPRRPRPGAQVDLPDPSVRKFQPAIAHSPASQPAQDLASCNPNQKELP